MPTGRQCGTRTLGRARCELAEDHQSPHKARLGYGVTVHWRNPYAKVPARTIDGRQNGHAVRRETSPRTSWTSYMRADQLARAASARSMATDLHAKALAAKRAAAATSAAAIAMTSVVVKQWGSTHRALISDGRRRPPVPDPEPAGSTAPGADGRRPVTVQVDELPDADFDPYALDAVDADAFERRAARSVDGARRDRWVARAVDLRCSNGTRG